jgi:sulfur carrier protein
MQTILFNNASLSMKQGLTLAELLTQQGYGYGGGGFAVAVNQTFVPRSIHTDCFISDGDKVDIVVPMQGG